MWDNHLTQVEVGGEVKGASEQLCERPQADNLKMNAIVLLSNMDCLFNHTLVLALRECAGGVKDLSTGTRCLYSRYQQLQLQLWKPPPLTSSILTEYIVVVLHE